MAPCRSRISAWHGVSSAAGQFGAPSAYGQREAGGHEILSEEDDHACLCRDPAQSAGGNGSGRDCGGRNAER